ncbi:MAG: hypothetical protein ACI9DC_001156 [Gammaproteobacteria bacterium]|jgi:hypothetical protein
MKLLLDESVPRQLVSDFPESIEVTTVQRMGWGGTENGAFLKLAAESGFNALLTADKGIEFQYNSAPLYRPIIVLSSYRTRWQDLQPLVPDVVKLLELGMDARVDHIGA